MNNKQTYIIRYSTGDILQVSSTLIGAKQRATKFLCIGHKVVIYDQDNNPISYRDISLSCNSRWIDLGGVK